MRDDDKSYKEKLISLLFLLVEQPKRYTKKEICRKIPISKSSFERDLEIFKNYGLLPTYDEKFRYYLRVNTPYKQLSDLLHFSEEDQLLLAESISKIGGDSNRSERLKKKLASLYDYHRLGHAYLRKPYLDRMNALQTAIVDKKQVILKNYRSTNSNTKSDRLVEPFHINPAEDLIQCYDLAKNCLLFFKLSRFDRVVITEDSWLFEHKHYIAPADPFRIVDDKQFLVHIQLSVGAYNDLLDRFPLTKSYIEVSNDPNWYDFQCKVNHKFLGISNFLLGNWRNVRVLEPENLREHLANEIKVMEF